MTLPDYIPDSLKLVSAEQSREIDQRTIEEFGISGFTLMEIAATGAADRIDQIVPHSSSGLYVAGKGNNGGDALAVARILSQRRNHSVTIYMAMGSGDLSDDAQKNLDLLQKCRQAGSDIQIVNSSEPLPDPARFDYLVDGLFGTGLSSDVRAPIDGIIERLNESGRTIFSMDIPSGLHGDNGKIMGGAVRADHTFVFGTMKTGLWFGEAATVRGDVQFVPLPFPKGLQNYRATLISEELEIYLSEIRRTARHKYENGVVHLVAGSRGMTGAAIMAAQAAWKHGAGAVFLYAPVDLLPLYEQTLPQVIKVPVGQSGHNFYREEHIESILSRMELKPGVLLAGPGVGRDEQTVRMVRKLLDSYSGAAVIDADGLAAITADNEPSADENRNRILTPHPGEAAKWLGLRSNDDDAQRMVNLEKISEQSGYTILSKGNPTMLCSPDSGLYLTGYDTSPFSRAGFGDVLAGTISAYYGITGIKELSIISALLNGYRSQINHTSGTPFGPEHLL